MPLMSAAVTRGYVRWGKMALLRLARMSRVAARRWYTSRCRLQLISLLAMTYLFTPYLLSLLRLLTLCLFFSPLHDYFHLLIITLFFFFTLLFSLIFIADIITPLIFLLLFISLSFDAADIFLMMPYIFCLRYITPLRHACHYFLRAFFFFRAIVFFFRRAFTLMLPPLLPLSCRRDADYFMPRRRCWRIITLLIRRRRCFLLHDAAAPD